MRLQFRRTFATVLDDATKKVLHATAPVLKANGLEITKIFYPLLFKTYPETKNIFNMSNQRDTAQQQALANAVYAFAENIYNLSAIEGAIEKVFHKHCALNVQPHMYPWVGECLLAAVKQNLGDAATPQIMDAWKKGYTFLAELFIAQEDTLFNKGAWKGFKPFVVAKKQNESQLVTSLYLQPSDGSALPSFLPGQYLTVEIDMGEHKGMRHYSLSTKSNSKYYRISVKREGSRNHDGLCSTYLHDYLREGDSIQIGVPRGLFTLNQDHLKTQSPLVFISGGIGCTPVFTMLEVAAASKSKTPIHFIHGCSNGAHHALKGEVQSVAKKNSNVQVHVGYRDPLPWDVKGKDYHFLGPLTNERIKSLIPSTQSNFYICGPARWMLDVKKALLLWGVKPSQIHYEFFGPEITD